jgi:hypothetical protein
VSLFYGSNPPVCRNEANRRRAECNKGKTFRQVYKEAATYCQSRQQNKQTRATNANVVIPLQLDCANADGTWCTDPEQAHSILFVQRRGKAHIIDPSRANPALAQVAPVLTRFVEEQIGDLVDVQKASTWCDRDSLFGTCRYRTMLPVLDLPRSVRDFEFIMIVLEQVRLSSLYPERVAKWKALFDKRQ